MNNLHLFAHMDRNYVRRGDKVVAYVTPIGTMGDGNGQYWAHLHHSMSNGLSVGELIDYVAGWSKSKVEKYYLDPMENGVDYDKMFGIDVDEGNRGYAYLQWIGYGYHPGIDINGHGGGNTDFGWKFLTPVSGTVVYEIRTDDANGGWGNIIIIEEDGDDDSSDKCYHLTNDLEEALERATGKVYNGDTKDGQKQWARDLNKLKCD